MITSKTFLFTSINDMSGEYTFFFSPFLGNIVFKHELELTVYTNYGKATLSYPLGATNIQLPYSLQVLVGGGTFATSRLGFGTLHIEAKNVTENSITVRYWIEVYNPGAWHPGLTYNGILKCLTGNTAETEIIQTFGVNISNPYGEEWLGTNFDFSPTIGSYRTDICIEAGDGTTTGGIKYCQITSHSGGKIIVPLVENMGERLTPHQNEHGELIDIPPLTEPSPTTPRKYHGYFFITDGKTDDAGSEGTGLPPPVIIARWTGQFWEYPYEWPKSLHVEKWEIARLQCDVNGDNVFSYREIYRGRKPPPSTESYINVYASSLYSTQKYEFNAEEIAHVIAVDRGTSGTSRSIIVRADSGDSIIVPLVEDIATRYKCSFKITAGATDKNAYFLHLESGEKAHVSWLLKDPGTFAIGAFIYRTGIPAGTPVETVKAYSDSGYGTEKDTFDLETNIFVEATNGVTTGGTKTLKVVADSGDIIYVTLTEGPPTCYRGYFKITAASTRDDKNEIHLVSNEKAILYCDVDDDGMTASAETWAEIKPSDPVPLDATHFQIQVNTQKDMLGTMMWDSQKCQFPEGVVVGPDERCPDIEYQGIQLDLSGNVTYWWRIRFWVNNGTLVTPWSVEEAYFSGSEIKIDFDDPDPDDKIPALAAMDIRKPRGKVEVLIDGNWTSLETVTAIQISNNKNPLDNIETAQGTAYLSNIDKKFYPDKSSSDFFNELFGRKIRLSLGFLDYTDTMLPIYRHKLTGIVKSINTNRKEKTAEIIALEFMDFYKTKELKITPVWENKSLTWIFCALVKQCFPSWRNQHETENWDYWVDPLGFRRNNIYLGSGEANGSEFLPIKDCLRTPCEWVYNIIPDSEAIYNKNELRLIRGIDYEIILEFDDKGTQSWIHFLKTPYPTDNDTFYATVTVDVKVSIVQYKNTTLIEELEKIALVADCSIYANDFGRLMCKSNALQTTITEEISHDTNLMDISTRKDIDSIVNHVVVESKPFQLGVEVEIGQVAISFLSQTFAISGAERRFFLDEFMRNFRFGLNWSIECMGPWYLGWPVCTGTGTKEDFELPLRGPDGKEGIELHLSGSLFCTDSFGRLHIETVSVDAEQIVAKIYIDIYSPEFYNEIIDFHADLTCKGEGIGQPETYRGEAIDEVSYQDRFIKKQKKTFVLEYLEPGDTQARQAAYALLASLRKIRVYYNCFVRGLPHLRLMNTVALTVPDLDLSAKNMQVIKLSDNMQIANYMGAIELLEKKIVTKTPFYWYPVEHDFIINETSQLTQTVKFTFNAEIDKYNFSHIYKLFVTTSALNEDITNRDCYGEGEDDDFDLPYSVDILVYYRKWGMDIPLEFGTLTISLIEETSTSIEIQYQLEVRGGIWSFIFWLWPIDWLGTLSLYVEFKREGEIVESGNAPQDEPHYPLDEPFAPPDDQPDDGWEYEQEFVVVGETSDRFIWALQKFSGSLYAGTYKMQAPRIYKYSPWEALKTFSGGESILRLREFNGIFFAASEDMGYAGKIYRRDSDTVWTAVHTETTWYPKPFIVFKNYLYSAWQNAAGNIKILRSSDGNTWNQVALFYNKGTTEFTIFRNELYLFGGYQPNWDESWAAKTSNGTTWTNVDVLCHHTYPVPWHSAVSFKDNLFIGQGGGKSIYKYDGVKKMKVFQALESIYGTHSCYVFDDRVYFFFSQAWKAASGDSFLYCSKTGESGDWELLQKFENTQNARGITEFNNKLYVAVDKKLYELRS